MPELGFFTVKEVSEILKIQVLGVYDLIKNGELKACRFSERRLRIDEKDLKEFIRRSKQNNPPINKLVTRKCPCC
jgi:excisionase family DNA binding protein